MKKAYKINTKNLSIRCLNPLDAYELNDVVQSNKKDISKWMYWAKKVPNDVQDKLNFIIQSRIQFDSGKNYHFGIFLKDSNKLIGSIGIYKRIEHNALDLSYWIDLNERRKGYTTEAVQAITHLSFQLYKYDRLEIRCKLDNESSNFVAKKAGFNLAYKQLNRLFNNERTTFNVWEIFNFECSKNISDYDIFNSLNEKIKST